MARDDQVALWAGPRIAVLLQGERDVPEAPLVAALTQERNRTSNLELPCLGGDLFVGTAENVLRLHCKLLSIATTKHLPIRPTTNLALRDRSKQNGRVGAREERLAQNEALFREVNERVAEVAANFIEVETRSDPVEFMCECGRVDCVEPIEMTVVEYEAVRVLPTRFAVVPAHEQLEVETVVERHPSYFVVEKQDGDAQEVARETDPRS